MTKARLLACPGCARHVRESEPTCVFCGVVLPDSFRATPVVPPPPRLNRGGLFTYRARALAASTAALVTASCGGTLEAAPSDAAPDGGGDEVIVGAAYGAPFGDDEVDASSDGSFGDDAAYGGPFPEASFEDSPLSDDGSFGVDSAYGAPHDASLEDSTRGDETIATLYGLPFNDGGPYRTDASEPRDASEADAVVIAPPYGIAPAYGLPMP